MKERANDAVAGRASRKTRGGPGVGKRMAGLRPNIGHSANRENIP